MAASPSDKNPHGDSGQRIHPQGQEHQAVYRIAQKSRREPVFFTGLQPRTKAHRVAVAQDQTHVDGNQMENRKDLEADFGDIL